MSIRPSRFRPFELAGLPSVAEAQRIWADALPKVTPEIEHVDLWACCGRVLGEDVRAAAPVPAFPRSVVDGVALRAADTDEARDDRPVSLTLVGKVAMGRQAPAVLEPGQAMLVPTGGMIPPGADAVVMVEEFPELLGSRADMPAAVAVRRAAAPGQNVIPVGADVKAGEKVMEAGVRLRPPHLGVLAGLGCVTVPVYKKPEVAILSTGEELVAPEEVPAPGQIRDMNGVGLAAFIEEGGGRVKRLGIARDDRRVLREALEAGLASDMVVLSGGSSVGEEDWVARIVAELGEPGIIVHGVKLAPGKPTLLALIGNKPVLGMPGNPVSALVVYRLFGAMALRRISGERDHPGWIPVVKARLAHDVTGPKGRELHMRVQLLPGEDGWIAQPIIGGSHQLMTMVKADGIIVVPPDTKLPAGTAVNVRVW